MKKLLFRLRQGAIGMLLGANIFTIALLWGSIACAHIPSSTYPVLSLLCLGFPVFVCFNLLFCLIWPFVRLRLAILPLLSTLLATPYLLDYCPIHFCSKPSADEQALCVVSFNAGWLKQADFDQLTDYLERMKPDIVCLQEFNASWKTNERAAKLIDSLFPYSLVNDGREIYTRFPLEEATLDIPFPTRTNGCVECWLDIDGERVLLFNNHFESNHFDQSEKAEYSEALSELMEEQLRHSGRKLASKMRDAAVYRGQQTSALCEWLDQHPKQSIIICGDFNDTPISYTYQQLARRLRSAFRDSGSGLGFSFNTKGFPVRIDHIFYSSDWKSLYTFVDRSLTVSDHYPLVTYLKRK